MKKIPTTEEIQDAMLHVFDRATKTRGLDILGALVPHTFDPVRAIWNVPDHEAEELCRFVNQFTTYVTKGHDAPALTRRVLPHPRSRDTPGGYLEPSTAHRGSATFMDLLHPRQEWRPTL